MEPTQLKPNDRYAFVGKTRSGKTALAMVLVGVFIRSLPMPWEAWWIDTKNDPADLAALRKWGFRNAASEQDMNTPGAIRGAKYFRIDGSDNKFNPETVEQAQQIIAAAYAQKYVIIVIDEYTQVTPSSRNAGKELFNVFQRGGGRNVGLIGLTQEPVYVPRQLLSSATHLVLLSLSFHYDVTYIQKMEPVYKSPNKMGDRYGFFWKWVDGDNEVEYYPHQAEWYDKLRVAFPSRREPLPA